MQRRTPPECRLRWRAGVKDKHKHTNVSQRKNFSPKGGAQKKKNSKIFNFFPTKTRFQTNTVRWRRIKSFDLQKIFELMFYWKTAWKFELLFQIISLPWHACFGKTWLSNQSYGSKRERENGTLRCKCTWHALDHSTYKKKKNLYSEHRHTRACTSSFTKPESKHAHTGWQRF